MKTERGGLVLGLMVGVLIGLALALAVALYVTKAPVPFVNKVPPRTADQDAAEQERNRNWDPNAGLAGRSTRAGDAASAPVDGGRAPTVIAPPGSRDPAAILSGSPVLPPAASASANRPATNPGSTADAAPAIAKAPPALPPVVVAPAASAPVSAKAGSESLIYFVQAGAFQGSGEAEQQKAKLAMLGVEAKVIEREQSGRMVFRVRAGPFNKMADADAVKAKLAEAGVDTLLVRVDPRQP